MAPNQSSHTVQGSRVRELEFRMLGPLEVRADGALLDLRSGLARRLLARLLLDPNRVVASDRLVDDLLGERPRATALNSLFNAISRLRTVVGDALVTRPPGFELRVDWTRTDIHRFEQLAAAGRRRLATGDLVGAGETLRLALDLWRGEPFGDLGREAWARPEVLRLEELRLGTIEDRIAAELARGNPAVLAMVERLVAQYPARERLRVQLMRALNYAGRQADALAAYRDARRFFADELGLDVNQQLRAVHANVLSQLAVPVEALASTPDEDEGTELIVVLPSSVAPAASRQTQQTTEATARLFDDWAFRLGRGEWPDPHYYLELADDNADELRLLMDTYIRALPRPAPAQEDIERAQAWLTAAAAKD